jgi:hypothetical protein
MENFGQSMRKKETIPSAKPGGLDWDLCIP